MGTHVPARIGEFEILDLLGKGGMGEVYLGRDPSLDRRVAIKVVKHLSVEDKERFLREARVAASLRHPNLATIYSLGTEGDTAFIVQELLEGFPLSDVIREAPTWLNLEARADILYQIAQALAGAHARQVVHRDIKPGNVMVEHGGRVVVMDFGIAKAGNDDSSITRTGLIVGTPEYMSPEAAAGETVGPPADVFSFGVVAYELLTGTKPFSAAGAIPTLMQIVSAEPQQISRLAPSTPPRLAHLVTSALRKDPEDRPTIDAIVDELSALRTEQGWESLSTRELPIRIKEREESRAPTSTEPNTAELASITRGIVAAGGTVIMPHGGVSREHGDVLPSQLGDYTLHEFIAEGRTGKLYKAYDPLRGRLVGLKALHNRDGLAQKRLLRGAGLWLDLHHPNVLRILRVDLGERGTPPIVVTELVDGTDLEELLNRRRLSLEQKIAIVIQVCDALEYLHGRGIIHREVKPRNILVTPSTMHVTLLDSGIARATDGASVALTRTGMLVGDLDYMAPEQARGHLDQRSDIYAAGLVLYRLLYEETPGPNQRERMLQRLDQPEYPERLRSAARRALDPDPDRRYTRAGELGDHLREFVPEAEKDIDLRRVVATLHGIRTHAGWQRAFAEVASSAGLECRLDRWNYGWFSTLRFLLPWARRGRVKWFRATYRSEFGNRTRAPLADERPSIVAHSFGTYILGNALLTYPYLRFNKVLLCGSILPTSFPWDDLIARGQIQAVRNEYGTRDLPTRIVQWFVSGTGPSGIVGFSVRDERLRQERFEFSHSEYFERAHMLERWIPFLKARESFITPQDRAIEPQAAGRPWGLYCAYLILSLAVVKWWPSIRATFTALFGT